MNTGWYIEGIALAALFTLVAAGFLVVAAQPDIPKAPAMVLSAAAGMALVAVGFVIWTMLDERRRW